MASVGGVGAGSELGSLMSSLRSAGGGGGAMGAATEKFGSAMESAMRGDVSGTMNQLTELTKTDPDKLYESGPLAEAARAGARRAMPMADGGSVSDLVSSLSKAVQNRIETTEVAKTTAETSVQTLLTGGDIDLHNVILASERAGLETKLTMTLRNKLIEAYQEVMRIPV